MSAVQFSLRTLLQITLFVACWIAAFLAAPGVALFLVPALVLVASALFWRRLWPLIWLPAVLTTTYLVFILVPMPPAGITTMEYTIIAGCAIASVTFALRASTNRYRDGPLNGVLLVTMWYSAIGCCLSSLMVTCPLFLFSVITAIIEGRAIDDLRVEESMVVIPAFAVGAFVLGLFVGLPLGIISDVLTRVSRRRELAKREFERPRFITISFEGGSFAGEVSFFETSDYPVTNEEKRQASDFYAATKGRLGANAIVDGDRYRVDDRNEGVDCVFLRATQQSGSPRGVEREK